MEGLVHDFGRVRCHGNYFNVCKWEKTDSGEKSNQKEHLTRFQKCHVCFYGVNVARLLTIGSHSLLKSFIHYFQYRPIFIIEKTASTVHSRCLVLHFHCYRLRLQRNAHFLYLFAQARFGCEYMGGARSQQASYRGTKRRSICTINVGEKHSNVHVRRVSVFYHKLCIIILTECHFGGDENSGWFFEASSRRSFSVPSRWTRSNYEIWLLCLHWRLLSITLCLLYIQLIYNWQRH